MGDHEVRAALAACRRAIHATLSALTETARREVHVYLSCEVDDPAAAEEWYEMALAPRIYDDAALATDERGEGT